jgi:adenylate cyclase
VSEVEGALRKLGFPTADWTARVCELLELPGAGHEAGPTDPEERRRSLSAALRRAVQARGARGPNLIVVDDAQWVDAESREVLNDFVDAVGWTRTLLLLDYRPEFSPGWESHSYFREHPLEPLDGDAGAALLEDWLGADASVAALTEPILERTSGTPFFIEEVVRELVRLGSLVGERGAYRLARPVGEVGEIEIPHSVTDAIASRVDALPETDKELVQLASVIGQTGSLELLQRVSGRESVALELSLGVLARASLVLPGGGQTWDFVHPLTREVAYAAQLQEVRVARHVAVAHALEELYADRLGQQAHLIAHHFGAAGQEHRARRWRLRAAMRVSQIQVRRIDRAD